MPQEATIVDKQLIEVPIAGTGPNEPNRMFVCTGKLQTNFHAYVSGGTTGGITQRETYTALIEPKPQLTEGQFKRAVATASVASMQIQDSQPTQWDSFQWAIEETEADLDDESSQVELRVSLMGRPTGQQTSLTISEVAFQVTILAKV